MIIIMMMMMMIIIIIIITAISLNLNVLLKRGKMSGQIYI